MIASGHSRNSATLLGPEGRWEWRWWYLLEPPPQRVTCLRRFAGKAEPGDRLCFKGRFNTWRDPTRWRRELCFAEGCNRLRNNRNHFMTSGDNRAKRTTCVVTQLACHLATPAPQRST